MWKSKKRKACPNCTKLKHAQWKRGRKDCHTSNVTLPYTMAWPAWKMSHSQLRTSIMANYTFSLPLLCSKRKNRKEKKKFSQHKHCTQKLALVQTWYNCASFGSFIFRKVSQKSLPICLQTEKRPLKNPNVKCYYVFHGNISISCKNDIALATNSILHYPKNLEILYRVAILQCIVKSWFNFTQNLTNAALCIGASKKNCILHPVSHHFS